jgi:hypothetical protein
MALFYKNEKKQWRWQKTHWGNNKFHIHNSDILFLLTVNNNSKTENLTHLTTKIAILNNSLECDLWKINNLVNSLNMDSLYIFSLIKSDTFEYKINDENTNVKYTEVGSKYFKRNLKHNDNVDFWEYNKNSLYILRNGDFSDIRRMFKRINNTKVQLVRGSSQKSHMVSPIDFRLSLYLTILCNMDFKYFRTNNSFNKIDKKRYLPSSQYL